ncbi:caspase family protein [Streptomyces sp. NPDC048623]|uniref:HD domain-containing protein n=1 Tax=Streptomyces sp. NPDC048623 TaxID=3155761 RepID=UPI003445CCFE
MTTGASRDTAAGTHGGTGTGRRRALLIGVGRTEFLERDPVLAARFPRLDFVDRDIELVGTALADSDYKVDTLHPGHPQPERRDTRAGAIVFAIEEFLRSCSPGDTAFLYLSCHGVSVDGRDFLLASDARARPDGSFLAQTVLETAPDVLLGPEPVPDGVTVVVCLDMCRTRQPTLPAQRSLTRLVDSAYENVAWLRSSGRGEPAYADPEKGSYFGIALSEALSPASPPRTFQELHAFVHNRVGRLTAHLTEPPPTVEFQCAEERAAALVLCRGSQETLRWTRAVAGSALWAHTSGGAAVHQRVKDRLDELAREVAKSRLGTGSALDTPWNDSDYPVRVMSRLGRLVEAAGLTERERLSPAETAALLAAPLLHEGVVAVALSELAALRPDRLDRQEDGRGRKIATPHDQLVCDAARDVFRAHSQVALAAETLRRRKLREAATAADHWLRHRFIADWDRLWDHTGDYPAVDHLIGMVVAAVAAGAEGDPPPSSSQAHDLVDRQVRQVLPHMTVAPGSSPRINHTSESAWRDYRAVRGNTWRGRDLATLLWLAALLAPDPRRMSSVLVDHLGAHRPLAPADVVAALAHFDLEPTDRDEEPGAGSSYGLAVVLACPHPALHAAVEELAGVADASVRALRQSWKEDDRTAPALLRGIPRKVTTEFLKPLDDRYTEPLERFRLAEDEIRPLLMGTQLYGDRMLAVRELYQNALDACRHRQLRTRYGHAVGECGASDSEPEISFVQGYDEQNRPYIECRDTGTGMSRKKLTSMFARAGKRYEQDPDFVQERRNWRRAGIDPIPFNSRFGIGVFSYFMLAEEVVVTTSTIDFHGNPSRTEAPLQATIQSGSGLLEIRETRNAPERGGTVVRLYLSADADGEAPPSLVETLRKLLWVSDHRVTAVERDQAGDRIRFEEWTPGELKASVDWPTEPARATTADTDDVWIVQGTGQLLLDGLVVKNAPTVHGYVFNLRERDQPVPTVDRNGLLRYDKEGVERRLLTAVPEAMASFKEVSLRWLWDLARTEPKLAVEAFDALDEQAVGVLHVTHAEFSLASSSFPLRTVGCLPIDSDGIQRFMFQQPLGDARLHESELLERWRNSLLGVLGDKRDPFTPLGYPAPLGLAALLFQHRVPEGSWTEPLRAAALTGQSLAVAVRAQRRFAITGVWVPAVTDVRSLRDIEPTVIMADLFRMYDDARPDPVSDASHPARFAPLLPVAAAHEIPLVEAVAAAGELTRGVPVPGWEDLPQVPQGVVTETETAELAAPVSCVNEEKGHVWHEGAVHAVDLLVRAPSVEQRERLAARIDDLRELGFSMAPGISAATLGHRALTGDERRLLSRDLDGERPWVTHDLTMLGVLERSAEMKIPIGGVVERINNLTAATGVSAPPVPEETATWIAPYWVTHLLPWPTEEQGPFKPWRLAAALRHAASEGGLPALRQDLRCLDACGVLAPGCLELVEAHIEQLASPAPVLAALLDIVHTRSSYGNGRWDLDASGLCVEPLAHLAARQRTTLGVQIERLEKLDLPLPLNVADIPETLRSLAPDLDLKLLFEEGVGHRMAFRAALTPQLLLLSARHPRRTLGTAVRSALAFRPAGGPALPGPFTGPDAEALEDFVPDDFDLAAFDPGLLGPGVLGPLELVLVAGRFGWTLGKAYERYAPFRCLGLHVTVSPPDETEQAIVPDWRDVIVLTTQLTGRAPAVTGTVDPDHIVLCSEETDLTEPEVLGRLQRYARLFSLDLPTTTTPTGGPRS